MALTPEIRTAALEFLQDESSFQSSAAMNEVASAMAVMVELQDVFRLVICARLLDYGGALEWLSWCHAKATRSQLRWDAHDALNHLHAVFDLVVEDL